MSVMLIGSSVVTTLLIPPAAFPAGGAADGRALAYLAHEHLGETFGTVYDLSTIAILWFAGASAMAGLLNLVPRYLPRYGMAPEWARATRPLVLIFTAITFLVTLLFEADVDAQGGAYATGVLVLMTSAAVAVTLRAPARPPLARLSALITWSSSTPRRQRRGAAGGDQDRLMVHRDDRRESLISRVLRSTELRVRAVELDATALRTSASGGRAVRIIAHRPEPACPRSTNRRSAGARGAHLDRGSACFLEVTQGDASEFSGTCGARATRWAGTACCAASARRFRTPSRPCSSTSATDRADPPRLLRLDGGQSDHLSAQVPGVRRGRHGARDPRGAAQDQRIRCGGRASTSVDAASGFDSDGPLSRRRSRVTASRSRARSTFDRSRGSAI